MCKRLADILFPLNILGGNNGGKLYPANVTVVRPTDSAFSFSPAFSGDSLTIEYTKPNGESAHESIIASGYIYMRNIRPGTDVIFSENLSSLSLMSYNGGVEYISLGGECAIISTGSSVLLAGGIDFRNIRRMIAINDISAANNISKICTYGNYNITGLATLIQKSTITNGVLYINTRSQYATPIVNAAVAKGWTIRTIYG